MFNLERLSIRSKLVIALLLASFASMSVIAYQGFRSGKEAITEGIHGQLTTLRQAKTEQVQAYFQTIHDQTLAFAENRDVIEALSEFRTAYRLADRTVLEDEQKKELSAFYREQFLPRMRERMAGEPQSKHYLPEQRAASYLQYHYLVRNPHPVGEKDGLVHAPDDGGYYGQVHERYHEALRGLIRKFGYYDLFLIDHESGEILYSVFKEVDFATSMVEGPFAATNLARLTTRIIRERARGKVRFQDYETYAPSYGQPAAFVAVTVFDGQDIVGILALQIPSSDLNDVMTSGGQWQKSGMGETGEVYLVGRDHLMRSDSRFLLEDHEQYLEILRSIGMPAEEVSRIDKNKTTILFQPVPGSTVDQALNGQTGIDEINDYRGVPVVCSFAPLRIQGMDWVILSEKDLTEINQPITRFRRRVLGSAIILGVLITLAALLIAGLFTRPITLLVSGLHRVIAGDRDVHVPVVSQDEIGDLTKSFNALVDSIGEQEKILASKERENELLLLNILPAPIAERMQAGEENIVDRLSDVTVVFASLTGFGASEDEDPKVAITRLNHLVAEFDSAAEQYGIDKIKTIGDDYMAACGVVAPHLDHAKRTLDFAKEMMAIVERIGRQYDRNLELRIGLHSGPILAGVIGRTRFLYDIWGKTVDIANDIREQADSNGICLSGDTHQFLQDPANFHQGRPLQLDDGEQVLTWHLSTGDENHD